MRKTAKRLLFGLVFLYSFTIKAFAADMLVPVGQVIGLELYHNTVPVVAFDDHIQTGRDAGLQIGDEIRKIDGCKIETAADVRHALETSDGSVTFTCFGEKPLADLAIQMEVNR